MEQCAPERLTPNTVMLCVRNMFLLENMRDIMPYEYNSILASSGCVGIIKA